MESGGRRDEVVGYVFEREEEARECAAELDRHFGQDEIAELRIYRVRWNEDFIVEATFHYGLPRGRIADARAILGESGGPVHPDDLRDYKRAMQAGATGPVPGWLKKLFGGYPG